MNSPLDLDYGSPLPGLNSNQVTINPLEPVSIERGPFDAMER